jgi:hypothetical protein
LKRGTVSEFRINGFADKTKRARNILLALLLVIAAATSVLWGIPRSYSYEGTSVYIDPPSVTKYLPDTNVGDTFKVYIKIDNFTDLAGYQYKVYWNNTVLNCVGVKDTILWSRYLIYVNDTNNAYNGTNGRIYFVATVVNPGVPFNGSATIREITFKIMNAPPLVRGSCLYSLIHITNDIFGDSNAHSIPHVVYDGEFRYIMAGAPTPVGSNVTVSPAANVNTTFTHVTSPGITTVNVTQAPSEAFASAVCLDVKTTATYSGNVTLMVGFNGTGLSLEAKQSMKIWLLNQTSGSWIDITSYVDTTNNVVYGVSPHLSIFGVTSELSLEGNVVTPGQITVTCPNNPPGGIAALRYYQIQTTTVFSGAVTVRFQYDQTLIPPESQAFASIWLWDQTSRHWTNVTSSVDKVNNVVYGSAPHFSIFGVTDWQPLPSGVIITEAHASKTIIGQGYNANINITVANHGGSSKSFGVTVYLNSTSFATQQVISLAPGLQTTLTFVWTTTSWAKSNYTVSSSGYLIGYTLVTKKGDINGDDEVDVLDLIMVAKALGTSPGDPKWNSNADINSDGSIDVLDLIFVAKYLGT